jgi:4a-hydroxytetrahydrobiopterin dehydratase
MQADEARTLLAQLAGWSLSEDARSIQREFGFNNYYETMAFVNAVAWVAHREDHHPDLFVTYKRCEVRLSTHGVGGLSRNDFICAAKFNALLDAD